MLGKYITYLAKHKWYVFVECCKLGIPLRGVIHDWSKIFPDEFIPYYHHFYTDIKTGRNNTGYYKPFDTEDPDFDLAWLKHQNRQNHHWQYFILYNDDGTVVAGEMPINCRKEMVADWIGAGKAQGKLNTKAWYIENNHRMILGLETRKWVEKFLGVSDTEAGNKERK
jgi:hypothetical protein